MMMMATSPSMISGEILMRTRRMGKMTRSQVMGTRLKRKVPRFLKRRDQGQGPRTLLRNVHGGHGHRAPAHRGLDLDRGRSEGRGKEDQEALQVHLQVGSGLGAEERARRSQRSAQRRDQDPDLGRGRREEDRPPAVGPEVAQDGQGAPSRAPRNELEPEVRMKPRARAPM